MAKSVSNFSFVKFAAFFLIILRVSVSSATPTTSTFSRTDLLNGRIADDSGDPIQNVSIYVPDLGSAITNIDGEFSIVGAKSNRQYSVFVQRTGFQFISSPVSVSVEQSVSIEGTESEFNPQDCDTIENSTKLNSAAENARKLRRFATQDLHRLNQFVNEVEPSKFVTGETTLVRRVDLQFNDYLSLSREIPEIALNCAFIDECNSNSLVSQRETAIQEVNNLRREALMMNRILRLSKVRPEVNAGLQAKRIVRISNVAKRTLRSLPRRTYTCDSANLTTEPT